MSKKFDTMCRSTDQATVSAYLRDFVFPFAIRVAQDSLTQVPENVRALHVSCIEAATDLMREDHPWGGICRDLPPYRLCSALGMEMLGIYVTPGDTPEYPPAYHVTRVAMNCRCAADTAHPAKFGSFPVQAVDSAARCCAPDRLGYVRYLERVFEVWYLKSR